MNHIALVYKGNGASIAACSRCTSDAVHIVLGVAGRIKVQDEGNVVDVDATRHDVGSYKDVGMSSLEGEHDFAAFCAAGGSQNTTVRRLNKVEVRKTSDGIIEIEVLGEAFLYNMVRIIAGTLLYVGMGKIEPDEIPDVIASCERERAGKTLPPEGLTLEEVFYDWENIRL